MITFATLIAYNPPKIFICRRENNCPLPNCPGTLSIARALEGVHQYHDIVCSEKHLVWNVELQKSSTILAEFTHAEWKANGGLNQFPKYLLIESNRVEKTGALCTRCNELFEYAEPTPNFKCYSCRVNPFYR